MSRTDSETYNVCEYLLRKHGPVYMKLGGAIEDSHDVVRATPKPPAKITPKLVSRMVKLYANGKGMNCYEISAALQVGRITVWRHLRQAGVWHSSTGQNA